MSRLSNPFPAYFLDDGAPAAFYVVYFGVANADPKSNSKAPFSDPGLANPLPATQTLTAEGAFETDIYLDGDYSILIEDTQGVMWRETESIESGFLPLSGGTLTGDLILDGDATAPLGAVTLQQMQAADNALSTRIDDNATNIQLNIDAITALDIRVTDNADAIDDIINGTDPVPTPDQVELASGTWNNGNPTITLSEDFTTFSSVVVVCRDTELDAYTHKYFLVDDMPLGRKFICSIHGTRTISFTTTNNTTFTASDEDTLEIKKVYGIP